MSDLAMHFPTGCWRQPDSSYAGRCTCGHTFHAATYAGAKGAWAEHAAPDAAASDAAVPAGEVKGILLPPAPVDDPAYMEGWLDGQTYLLLNNEPDAAPKFASDTDAAASEAGEVERLREAGQMAAFRAMYGDGADPFQNPESFDFCAKVADAVVAALTTQGGAEG